MIYFNGEHHEILTEYGTQRINIFEKRGSFSTLVKIVNTIDEAVDIAKDLLTDEEFHEFLRFKFIQL